MATATKTKTIATETDNWVAVQFTQAQLEAAFARVRNQRDWRAPINAVIDGEYLTITVVAIEYFTATRPTVRAAGNGCYQIEADGYRKGPAGDH